MKSEAAKELASLLRTTEKLQKLSVDYNELGPSGTKILMKVTLFLYISFSQSNISIIILNRD